MTAYQLEVCVDRIEDALVAIEAGATRIEFNYALAEDGLTPSAGACQALRDATACPVFAMLRPHNAGFYYTPREQQAMLADCEQLLAAGMDGLVIGGLTAEGQLDVEFLQQVSSQFEKVPRVMHRAFDQLADQTQALEKLIELGFCRVLTSGTGASVPEGLASLKALVHQAAGRIEILPGGGVKSSNALNVLMSTGVSQLHGSFSQKMQGVSVPDPAEISAVRSILERHSDAQ